MLAINFLQLAVVIAAGMNWEKWLSTYSLFHLLRHVPNWTGGVLAYFAATFVFYWWRRWRHTVNFLWQHFHQIHQSPQRIEVITSFYKLMLRSQFVQRVVHGLESAQIKLGFEAKMADA
jgi:sterol desaturase/sphingolipid hydroxylase (fatty acid hydroxylase superfamily)